MFFEAQASSWEPKPQALSTWTLCELSPAQEPSAVCPACFKRRTPGPQEDGRIATPSRKATLTKMHCELRNLLGPPFF